MPNTQGSSNAGKFVAVIVAAAIIVAAYLIYKNVPGQGGVAAPGSPVKVSVSAPAAVADGAQPQVTVTVEASSVGGTVELSWTWTGCTADPFVGPNPVVKTIGNASSITTLLTVSGACTGTTVVTIKATLTASSGGTRESTTVMTLYP